MESKLVQKTSDRSNARQDLDLTDKMLDKDQRFKLQAEAHL